MKELLEKYWKCETSPEEELKLRKWLENDDLPGEFIKYRSLFSSVKSFAEIKAPEAIIQNITSKIKNDTFLRPDYQIGQYLKIAASVLIVVSIGLGIYTHYQQEKFLQETFSETYTDPQEAIKETRAVLDKVSSGLLIAKDLIGDTQEDSINSESVPVLEKSLKEEE